MAKLQITSRSLKSTFGTHAAKVLKEYLKPLDRTKGQMQKYEIIKTLPSRAEFHELRNKTFTTTVESLITDAQSEAESLRDELQEWYDNLPESLHNGDKGQAIEEAISNIESCYRFKSFCYRSTRRSTVVHIPDENVSSRSDRRNEACSMAQSVIDKLTDLNEDKDVTTTESDRNDLIDELETFIDDLNNVEFPGMYEAREILNFVVTEINPIKSELIKLRSKLEDAGLKVKADQLGKIIGRLEAWQHKK